MEEIDIDDLNKKIENPIDNLSSLKGFEIIAENLIYGIYDIFGRNTLLSMLYQIGKRPAEFITNRIKEKYRKDVFKIEEAVPFLLEELKEYYSVKIKSVENLGEKVRILIENHCFLRSSFKNRKKLSYGSAFCRINKGYFEVAFQELTNIKKVDINFLENDDKNDVCIEELIFYLD